jgi:anti-sigma factor RsiW
MNGRHWIDEELLEHVYGLRAQELDSDEHLASCPECAARRSQMARVRAEVTQPPEVSDEFLAAQRRSIYQRLGTPLRSWRPLTWAVPAAVTLAIALGLIVDHGRQPVRSHDDQFYAEIASFDQNPAPRAVQPIEALVEDEIKE